MPKYATLILLAFALLWVVAGCTKTASDVTGAGFEALHPSPASRQFIIANDRPFAAEIAGHNATCATLPACRK